jgi:hypothetical protein
MIPLTIELEVGQKKDFTFLGWKEDGLAFYATAPDGQPAVIVPVTAYPAESDTGKPYRFPRMVPLEIVPKRFELGWTARQLEVLGRWRDAKLAEVGVLPVEELFVWDKMRNPPPLRSSGEIQRKRQDEKEGWERHYKVLSESSFWELLDPFINAGVLDEFMRGEWADELGEDFRKMVVGVQLFNFDWHHAYDSTGTSTSPQSMAGDRERVRFVMRGDNKRDYWLTSVDVRLLTDREAQAYAVMQPLMQGPSASRQRVQKTVESEGPVHRSELRARTNLAARLNEDCSVATIPQRRGEARRLGIEPELQALLKRIIAAGGTIPRIKLRQGKTDTFQPEKLLRSQTAQALLKAGLLGSQKNGRTTVFWAKTVTD